MSGFLFGGPLGPYFELFSSLADKMLGAILSYESEISLNVLLCLISISLMINKDHNSFEISNISLTPRSFELTIQSIQFIQSILYSIIFSTTS